MDEESFPVDEIVYTKSDRFYRVYGGFKYVWIDEGQNGAPLEEPSEFYSSLEEARAAAIEAGGGEDPPDQTSMAALSSSRWSFATDSGGGQRRIGQCSFIGTDLLKRETARRRSAQADWIVIGRVMSTARAVSKMLERQV